MISIAVISITRAVGHCYSQTRTPPLRYKVTMKDRHTATVHNDAAAPSTQRHPLTHVEHLQNGGTLNVTVLGVMGVKVPTKKMSTSAVDPGITELLKRRLASSGEISPLGVVTVSMTYTGWFHVKPA